MRFFEEYEERNIEDFSDRFAPIEHSQWNNFLEDNSPQESELLCREMADPLAEGMERYLCDGSPEYLEESHVKILINWETYFFGDDVLEDTDSNPPSPYR